jgi:hypothetical protein
MLVLRALLLEFLVCFHVIGGAIVFRRLWPRESPWLAFILPTLIVMCVFNFLEHFIALPQLGWLLPFTLVGLGVAMLPSGFSWRGFHPAGYSWEGLRFPAIVFLVVFTWTLAIRCANPAITCNTEGVADMARVLDFCLGGKLPAVDSWCPPYDHGGYYTFQHYGASLLKRLLTLDIGTGYNLGYNLLNTATIMAGTGAAFVMGGRRIWVAVATLLVLLANFNGSSVFLLYWNTAHPVAGLYDVFDSRLQNDIGDAWNDPNRHNPFGWIFTVPPPGLRLFLPAFNIYFPEFHANLSGHFLTLATLLAANECFREERTNWSWICLVVFPLVTIIMATWFMIVVTVLCVVCLAAALIAGKRPENWIAAAGGSCLATVLLWPSINTLVAGSYPVDVHLTPWLEYTNTKEFIIQWWPILVPWIALFFIWPRMNLLARSVHAVIPLLLIFFELVTFESRTLTVEKNWGACYGAALVTFLPLIFVQRSVGFRMLSVIFIFISAIFLVAWGKISFDQTNSYTAFHLRGDTEFVYDEQKKRLLQVLKRFHGVTVLNGKSEESYNQSPSLVGFSENRCYIAWFYQEFQCGHGGEAEFRDKQSNDFFAGKMQNPLAFLRSNDIAAVVIYPDDQIPDDVLSGLQNQLAGDYYYVDCKGSGDKNAGVFVRQSGAVAYGASVPPPR